MFSATTMMAHIVLLRRGQKTISNKAGAKHQNSKWYSIFIICINERLCKILSLWFSEHHVRKQVWKSHYPLHGEHFYKFCCIFPKRSTWQCIFVCSCEYVCNCKAIVWMHVWKKEVTRTSTSFTEHIAVFIRALSGSNTEKKVNLEQMVVAAHGFFFCFSLFLWYFSSFFCVRVLRLLLFCGMDNINKRDNRERQKKYTTYITLCYEQNINL